MDHQVPVSGACRRCRSEGKGIAARDIAQHGMRDLRRSDQPRPRAHADWDTAAHIGIEGGAIPQGQELPQIIVGVSESEEAILGAASLGQGILGLIEWECHR